MCDTQASQLDLNGPIVPILPALDAQEHLDVGAVCRWVDALIDRGVRLFWTTYGTTHFMCLTDDEIVELTRAVAGVTCGRAGLIASTAYHWPLQHTLRYIDQCQSWGVDAVKIQCDWSSWPPQSDHLIDFYARLAELSPLPLIAYTLGSPGITPITLKAILDMPRFIGLKNDSGDFYEQTWYLRTVRETTSRPFAVMTGGTMESAMHAWHFGGRAYAAGLAMFAPRAVLHFHQCLEDGDHVAAAALVRDVEQPVFGQMQRMGPWSHWAACHAALYLQGYFKTPMLRFPLKTFNEQQINEIRVLLETHDLLDELRSTTA